MVRPARHRLGRAGSVPNCLGSRQHWFADWRHRLFLHLLSHRITGNWLGTRWRRFNHALLEALPACHHWTLERTQIIVAEIPFDSNRKMMTTIHKKLNGGYISITKGAPDYNVVKDVDTEGYENGYLTKYVIAKIGDTEYYNLQSAVDGAPTGEYDVTLIGTITIESMQNNGTYYFQNTDGKLKPSNKGTSNSVANSYIKLDLSKFDSEQEYDLIVNASISSEGNYDIGYATITNSTTAPAYNSSTGRFMYISGTVAAKDYSTKLKGGSIYYLHLGYRKDGSGNTGDDQVIVNSIKFADTTIDVNSSKSIDITTSIPIPLETQTKIEILRNITEINDVVVTNKNIALDLNGNKVDLFKPITNTEGSLEIIDSSAGKTGEITNSATGTGSNDLASTIVNSGTLKVSAPISTKNAYSIGIRNSGALEVTSEGTVTLNGSYSYGIYNEGTGIATNKGTVKTTKEVTYGMYNKETGKIENVGSIDCQYKGSADIYGIYNGGTGEVKSSGEIKVTNNNSYSYSYGIYNSAQGSVTITGGNVTATAQGIYNSKGTITITGGKVTGSGYGINNNSGNVTMTGGDIVTTYGRGIYNNSGVITVTGGSVTSTSTSYEGIYNGSGTLTIGEKGGEVNTTVPEIKGARYGVNSTTSGTVNFYDGVVKGKTGAFNGTVTELEPNYQIIETTVDEYKCAKLLPIGEGIPSASIGSVKIK